MKRTNNFKRLTEEERMDLPPATVYPSDDPRSALAPVEGGYPEDYGLDLRDHQQMPDVPEMDFRDPVTIYATDDSRSRLPPRAGGYPERPRPEPQYGIPEPMLGPSQYGTPQPRERAPIQKFEPINENFERLRIQVPEKMPAPSEDDQGGGLAAAMKRAQATSAAGSWTPPDFLEGDYPGAGADAPRASPLQPGGDAGLHRAMSRAMATPRTPQAATPRASRPLDGEVPDSIKGALAGIGGVADRAQARMEADVPRPGSMRGLMASSAQSAAKGAATPQDRKPLVPPNGAAVPPEVAKFASDKMAEDTIAKSNRASMVERGLGGMTENVRAGLDTATRMRTPSYGGAMREDADRIDSQVAAAKEFALKKLGLDRQARQDRLGEEKTRAEIDRMGREGQPKPGDPLDAERKRAEIDKLKAETARLGRRGTGAPANGGKPENEYERLRNEKLRQEVTGEDPKKVAAADVSLQKIRGLANELRDVHSGKLSPTTGKREGGSGTELGSGDATTMGQYMTAMKIEAKNLAELGALSGPDEKLVEALQGSDPTTFWSNVKGVFGVDNTEDALTNFEKWAENANKAAHDIYAPKGAQSGRGSASPAPGKATPSGKQYVRKQHNAKMGKTRFLDAAGNVVEEANGLL